MYLYVHNHILLIYLYLIHIYHNYHYYHRRYCRRRQSSEPHEKIGAERLFIHKQVKICSCMASPSLLSDEWWSR